MGDFQILIGGKPVPVPHMDRNCDLSDAIRMELELPKVTLGMLTYADRPHPEIFPSFSLDVRVSDNEMDALRGLLNKNKIEARKSTDNRPVACLAVNPIIVDEMKRIVVIDADNIKRMPRQYRHSNPSKYYINKKKTWKQQ